MAFASEFYALTGTRLSRSISEEISIGLPSSAAHVIRKSLTLSMHETKKLLHCELSELKSKDCVLSTTSSDKTLFVMRVIQYGVDTFESTTHLQRWIRLPNLTLANKTPLELMHFSIGIKLVLDSLLRQRRSFTA